MRPSVKRFQFPKFHLRSDRQMTIVRRGRPVGRSGYAMYLFYTETQGMANSGLLAENKPANVRDKI